MIFRNSQSDDNPELRAHDGNACVVLRTITEPEKDYDAEVLPMHEVRFADGYETAVFPDELEDEVPT